MHDSVKVIDLTTVAGEDEAVAIVYFENPKGMVQVYRNGTVVLSSPVGTTVAALHQPDDARWRQTNFIQMLAQLGASEQALSAAQQMTIGQDEQLQRLGFPAAAQQLADESVAHFRTWCQTHGIDYEQLDEMAIDRLLEEAIAQVRTR